MKFMKKRGLRSNLTMATKFIAPLSLLRPRGDDFLYVIALLSIFSLLLHHIAAASNAHFEGFEVDDDDFPLEESGEIVPPLRSPPPPISLSTATPESHHGPPESKVQTDRNLNLKSKPASTSSFEYWDEDEFEGIPQDLVPSHESRVDPESVATRSGPDRAENSEDVKPLDLKASKRLSSFSIEIACVSFLVMFTINYFTGKKENENLALAWASKFGAKDSIFDKNFSLLGTGETEDSPLLLQEGKNVYKFYASGRRFCSGLLATMELKSRHDLISKLYNMVVPCKDEITFEVYMNDDAMDQVVFSLARKKLAKAMQKEMRDLQRFSGLMAPPSGKKWVAEELQVVSESKEVAGDLINEVVLDQVFGEKAFEKYGKGFISMHFSDQQAGSHKKMLVFKFALPDANHMDDMSRLVALVPYYIDLIGRYKLSSHARSKTDAARAKVAQEIYKELQNVRQEALQKKKADQRKKLEEAEAKLSAEALRKKEAKEHARQLKKSMPKIRMTRAN